MTLSQIENNITSLVQNLDANTFIYDFLAAYNAPKSAITRLKNGSLNLSKNADELIWKKKVFFKEVFTHELQSILPLIVKDVRIAKHQVRFVIATDKTTLVAYDTKTFEQIETTLTNIAEHVAFFLPLAGMEKYITAQENDADVKAAVQMAKLFDEIKKSNPTDTALQVHHLNIFLSRLLFCFFAEDTDIFTKNLFTSSISNHTQQDGSDLDSYLQSLFNVLNTEHRTANTPTYLKAFPYVNGGLFKDEIPLPTFTFKSRKAIIESGEQNWAAINPDIFGSMIQAVVTPDQRGNLGMHYTSVPNIMKVIKPLFLDELYDEFEAAKHSVTGLNKLLNRIANIRIFDPACGSGNFLIIAYKELRALEIKILLQLKNLSLNNFTGFEEKQQQLFSKPQLSLADAKPQSFQMAMFSCIELNHFYGIELDDFAHEVAKLSLWLAQHQMNVQFNELIGTSNPSLPLRDAGIIKQGNATRLDWETVCPKPKVGEVFILGNPPYQGSRKQDKSQKKDLDDALKKFPKYKDLDYIAIWFYKGALYIKNNNSRFAIVSTNSVCQGEQVSLLWPIIFSLEVEINFAYTSFKWQNNAKDNAGVSVIIIGLSNKSSNNSKLIYTNGFKKTVQNINAYLIPGPSNLYIYSRTVPLSDLPTMNFGNMPADGGKFLFSTKEKDEIIKEEPNAKKWFKKLINVQEYLNGRERWCLWLENITKEELNSLKIISQIVKEVRIIRLSSSRPQLAEIPHLFAQITQPPNKNCIIIPRVSSENRMYIPSDFLSGENKVTDSFFTVVTDRLEFFSIINSHLHMLWLKNIGGKLETRLQYSKNVVYNTFPFPPISEAQKQILEQHTHNILQQRALHTDKTLAELYDPEKMPDGLREAHKANDLAIEQCYRSKPFETDEERLAYLFKLYEQMIEEEKNKGSLFAAAPKTKKAKKK